MSLQDSFSPLFQASDGLDPQLIISTIQNDPDTNYFINALNFNEFILKDFIAEQNCSVVFHFDDGFDFNFRRDFIINIPVTAEPDDVVIYDVGFEVEELNKYGALGAAIYVNADAQHGMHQFTLVHLSNRFPGKVGFSPKGYSDAQVLSIITKAPDIKLLVQKIDFITDNQQIVSSVTAYINKGKERILIIKEGFSQDELAGFSSAGGRLV